jgi:hypothetical protein
MTRGLLSDPDAQTSGLSSWAGVYDTTTTGRWQDAFSPILINEDDQTIDFGGSLVTVAYDSEHATMSFSATVTEGGQPVPVTASLTLASGKPPTLNGELTIVGEPQTMQGTQLTALPAPTIANALNAYGLLDGGDQVIFQTRTGSYLTVNAAKQVVATATQPSDATTFQVAPLGRYISLTSGGQGVTVGAGNRLVVGGAPAAFAVAVSSVGYALLGDTAGNYWNLNTSDNTIEVIADDGLIEEMEFGLQVTPVSHAELCARYGIQPDLTLDQCDAEVAAFIWQVTAELFLALGLGSYVTSSSVQNSTYQLVMGNKTTNAAVTAAWQAINKNRDPVTIGSFSFKILAAILTSKDQSGRSMLWALVKLVLSELGWLALAWAVGKIVTVVALPQAQGAQTVAAFFVWVAQTLQAAIAVAQCPGGPSTAPAIGPAA